MRARKSGKRYVVRYRFAGRYSPLVHAGSFKTMKAARERRDFVIAELAAGRDPRVALQQLAAPKPTRELTTIFKSWKASRVDLDQETIANHTKAWKRIAPTFGERNPETIDPVEVQDWISEQSVEIGPGTLRHYLGTLRQVLDYARVRPNPARDDLLRLPTSERPVHVPPTDKHVLALLEHMPHERRLLYAFLEQDGGRIGEHVTFTWGDVDQEGQRILARPTVVKGRRGRRRARWLQIPAWLMEILLDTCAPEDRTGTRLLFPWVAGYASPEREAWRTMEQACKAAGIPHYHPNDLRHRRQSLWHGQGIPAREIADRVGHSKPSLSLDVYTHVMPLDEIPELSYRRVLVRSR